MFEERKPSGTKAVVRRAVDLVRPAAAVELPAAIAGGGHAFNGLLDQVFRPRQDGRVAIAFAACTPGEGVGYVVDSVARTLARQTVHHVLDAKVAALRRIASSSMTPELGSTNLWRYAPVDGRVSNRFHRSAWEMSAVFRASSVRALRSTFQYVLFDCESLKTSDDLSLVAGLSDGVVLVAEANRTRPAQINRARVAIDAAGGRLLGCVLNKRDYPIPNWLYRWL